MTWLNQPAIRQAGGVTAEQAELSDRGISAVCQVLAFEIDDGLQTVRKGRTRSGGPGQVKNLVCTQGDPGYFLVEAGVCERRNREN